MNLDTSIKALRAIGEPTRLRLLGIIAEGEIAVEELCAVLGQSQPRVSRHLRVLVDAGLATKFRDRHRIYYRLPRDQGSVSLTRQILGGLDADDPVLQADRRRGARVRLERERRALGMRDHEQDGDTPLRPESNELSGALDEILGSHQVGAVLDVGCGAGALLCLLGPRAVRAVGVDISEKMRLLARARVQRAGLKHVTLRQGDMHDLPVQDESFDLVVLDEVYRRSDDPRRLLREVCRVLRPSGRLLIYDRVARGADISSIDSLSLADINSALEKEGFAGGKQVWLLGAGPDIALLAASRVDVEFGGSKLRTGT